MLKWVILSTFNCIWVFFAHIWQLLSTLNKIKEMWMRSPISMFLVNAPKQNLQWMSLVYICYPTVMALWVPQDTTNTLILSSTTDYGVYLMWHHERCVSGYLCVVSNSKHYRVTYVEVNFSLKDMLRNNLSIAFSSRVKFLTEIASKDVMAKNYHTTLH